ncbi:U-box domain-containing protein 45-like [Iris pallida]|nr:U-box domain-containing protein 45-like [Iris pallida]
MCKVLYLIVHKVLEIFPFIEASRPRSKSGIQALCSLHVALDRAKTLLKHCSECSKLYLAITGDSILMKFEKARCALQDSLRRVENIVPQAIGCQIVEIVGELEGTVFELDQSEKEVGDDTISLLQKERQSNHSPNNRELEIFHHVALRLGITSSRAALSERRALKKLIERSRAEEDKRKESIVSYLLHLMRKYSKLFRSDVGDDTDSQGSTPCSPTIPGSFEEVSVPGGHGRAFSRHFSKLSSFSFEKKGRMRSANMPIPPEELRCPISLQLMYDPVIISSGQTYDRACIDKWFNDGHSTCPKTRKQLEHLGLTPNYCIKGLIASWCEHNGIPIPDSPPESLDVNYWRLACSDSEATDSRSLGSLDSCMLKGVKVVPLEETGGEEELKGNEMGTPNNNYCQYVEADDLGRYESLLASLHDSRSSRKQKKAVEQIRFLLKDDDEGRIYMGANGAVDALVQFLRSAVDEGDVRSQDVGTMALFNLAVNNNRNKGLLISAGVIPLLEFMISNSETQESATALYLNLSCLDEAKPIIGLSPAAPFLIRFLYSVDSETTSSKHDALYTLYNLSTHPSNIQPLLNAGIVSGLHSLLTSSSLGDEGLTWVEKALAVLLNLALSKLGKKEIVSTPGIITGLATVLDIGEPAEQEQVVSCLLILCNGDEKCSQMVLQEGVIPALVSVSVNGTTRGREKAQKLLKLFREQRQREPSPVHAAERKVVVVAEQKPLCKTRSRLGRALSSLWKNKNFSVYQC